MTLLSPFISSTIPSIIASPIPVPSSVAPFLVVFVVKVGSQIIDFNLSLTPGPESETTIL